MAILGAGTVVGSAICALIEGSGHHTNPPDSCPTRVIDQLLGGTHLLLLAFRLDGGREAFVGAMGKSTPQRASMPVIALSTAVEEGLPEKQEVISVP